MFLEGANVPLEGIFMAYSHVADHPWRLPRPSTQCLLSRGTLLFAPEECCSSGGYTLEEPAVSSTSYLH